MRRNYPKTQKLRQCKQLKYTKKRLTVAGLYFKTALKFINTLSGKSFKYFFKNVPKTFQ